MLKVLVEKWNKNKERLSKALRRTDLEHVDYKDLVRLTFDEIYNDGVGDEDYLWYGKLDTKHITEVDDGDYQGTLLFLIPFNRYQPTECDYLMTYIGYGSCSGCDTLQGIQNDLPCYGQPTEQNIADFMGLCRDIICNTIKPYNSGWRYEECFNTVDVKE